MYVSGKTQADLRYDMLNASFREGLSEEAGGAAGKGYARLDDRRKAEELLPERRADTDTVSISTRAMAAYKEYQDLKRDLAGAASEAEPADEEGRVAATAENGSDMKLKESENAETGLPSTDSTDQLKQQLKEAKQRLEEAKKKLEETQEEAKNAETEGELAAANARLQAAQQEVSSAQASVTELSSQIQVLGSSG